MENHSTVTGWQGVYVFPIHSATLQSQFWSGNDLALLPVLGVQIVGSGVK